jgi:EAL domain-containing protein (putative c-di-GMP-specific phosphodiesterase class I)
MSMTGALDIRIVAEGVETLEQLRELQALSCDEIQGHFVSRAVPTSEAASLLLKRFLFPPSVLQDSVVAI